MNCDCNFLGSSHDLHCGLQMLLPALPKGRLGEEYVMTCRQCKMRWDFTRQCGKAVGEAEAEREGWMKAVVTCSTWGNEINHRPKLFPAKAQEGP